MIMRLEDTLEKPDPKENEKQKQEEKPVEKPNIEVRPSDDGGTSYKSNEPQKKK